ncbi:tetratricopeptide repeat protein [bacterium]|nr:MAG: tetratricopeptide repeat protein [bacterium]
MSIIHDALKKVENSPNLNAGGTSNGYGNFWQSAPGRSRKVAVVAGIGSAAAALIVASVFMQYRGVIFNGTVPVKTLTQVAKAQPQITPAVNAVNADPKAAITPVETDHPDAGRLTTPENEEVEIRGKRGLSFYASGRYTEAVDEFKAALVIVADPVKKSVFYNNTGQAYSRLEEQGNAEAAFKQALKLNSAYPEALNNYGVLLLKKGDYAKALDLFNKAVSLRKDYADAYLNVAVSLEYMRRHAEAAQAYEKFLSLNSAKPDRDRQENTTEIQKRLKGIKAGILIAD